MYLTAPANIDDLVVQILKQKESCRLSDFHWRPLVQNQLILVLLIAPGKQLAAEVTGIS